MTGKNMESVESRFLRYVKMDTQSDPGSDTFPSTAKQLLFLGMLREEMLSMGIADASMDGYGYLTGTIPPTTDAGCPVTGFLAHVDTSPDMPGEGVNPKMAVYGGGDVVLSEDPDVRIRVSEFPEIGNYIGQTLITSDGTTLLGADDKAGVAEIMTAAEYLLRHPEVRHGAIRIAFTPDEETGRGADHFDVKAFGADYAYTVDGGPPGELEYENFNAADAEVEIRGENIHPGYAKGRMINALRVAMEFDAALPQDERPETTEGYEGFFHLTNVTGDVGHAVMKYIIRDHDRARFEQRKETVRGIAGEINRRYGREVVSCRIDDRYYNMREKIEERMEAVEIAAEAMRMEGIEPVVRPIRGGTDGARLSWMGLPCPNIFAGGMNFHSRYEYISVESMRKAVATIVRITELAARNC